VAHKARKLRAVKSLTEITSHSYTPRALQRIELPNTRNSEITNTNDLRREVAGRLLALDLGEKRVGVAVSDELQITVRPLPPLRRTNWKELLRAVADLVQRFDAQGIVIGLPLNLNGDEGEPAKSARQIAHKFELSLKIQIYLQDERLTSREAEESLRVSGFSDSEVRKHVDSHAAAIILRDFIVKHSSL
jgi:putative Holliday junction resolvase